MKEIWKDIKGYEGIYKISNYGKVKRLAGKWSVNERMRKTSKDKDGYEQVVLNKNGKPTTFKIHKLVAINFLENPNNYICVNHKDEDKSNNYVDNLEWCSVAYNNSYGSRKYLNCKKVICINTGEIFSSTREAEEKTGINHAGISRNCRGIYKTSGKHHLTGENLVWRYLEDVEFVEVAENDENNLEGQVTLL